MRYPETIEIIDRPPVAEKDPADSPKFSQNRNIDHIGLGVDKLRCSPP